MNKKQLSISAIFTLLVLYAVSINLMSLYKEINSTLYWNSNGMHTSYTELNVTVLGSSFGYIKFESLKCKPFTVVFLKMGHIKN